jgi:hypothetical protein
VVDVAAFPGGPGAARLAQRTVDRHEVHHRAAHAQVRHAELRAPGDVLGTQHVAIEAAHPLDVVHAQDEMVDFTDADHPGQTSS